MPNPNGLAGQLASPLFMATKAKTNLLIGAKILIDYPNRWKGARNEETRQRLRAETEASKNSMDGYSAHYFGETATVIAYNHNADDGKEYEVLLDSTHEIISLNYSWFTVAEVPKPDAEVVAVLTKILAAIEKLETAVVKTIKNAEPAL